MSKSRRGRSKVKLSRSLGIVLTPKAAKYFERRPYPPGVHGRTRRRGQSEYAIRLHAKKQSGRVDDVLIGRLESRLDAVVARSGFARTTAQARQLVVHRHIGVNGSRVDKPSFQVKLGDVVHVLPKSRGLDVFRIAADGGHAEVIAKVPDYLDVNLEQLTTRFTRPPVRSEIPIQCELPLVVEFYAGR